MNLAMVLQWMQVTFECYESIQMLYIEKKFFGACMAGLTYVMLVHDWKKGTLGEGPYVTRV